MKTLIWIIAFIMLITFCVFGVGISLEIVLGVFAFLFFLLMVLLMLPETKFTKFIKKLF